jgi:hypothetical protein
LLELFEESQTPSAYKMIIKSKEEGPPKALTINYFPTFMVCHVDDTLMKEH